MDPLTSEYSYLTPYQFAANSPIENIDLDGLENLSNKEIQNSILENVTELHTGDEFTIIKRTEIIPAGTDPKPTFEIYPGRFRTNGPENIRTVNISGREVTIYDQYSHFRLSWFNRDADRHKSSFHIELIGLFSPSIYKGGKFTEKFLKTSRAFKNVVKGVNPFRRVIPNSGFKKFSGRSAFIDKFNSRFNKLKENINKKLDGTTLEGAIKDIHNLNPTGNNSNGQHFDKVSNAIQGLKNQVEFFENALSSNKLFGEAKAAAGAAVKAGKEAINHAEKVIKAAYDSKKKFP